jgi:predicted flap endonuclease-1-like 5' DNA nuclease
MKRLLRFLGLVAGFAAVAYLLRDRLVRVPEEPTPPPHFRQASPNGETATPRETTAAALADDLTDIVGIGPVYAKRLAASGITSFAELATADIATTAAAVNVAADRVAEWVEQARQRLR